MIAEPSTDGRRRRSEQSRDRIIAAMLALVEEGAITPSAEDVAARAEVGLRSVFRHFNDMDSLYAEMAVRVVKGFESSLGAFAAQDWRGQLFEALGRRVTLYDRLLPLKRAVDAHRHESAAIQTSHDAVQMLLRHRLKVILPAAIGDDRLAFETLDLLMSFESWQRLRVEQKLPTALARDLIESAVSRLLG